MDKTLISEDDFYTLRDMARQYEKSQKASKKFEEEVAVLRVRKKLQEDDVAEAEDNLKKLKGVSLRRIGAKIALQYNQKLESAVNAEAETKRRLEECSKFLVAADDKFKFYLGDTQATLPSKEKYELLVEELLGEYISNSEENKNEIYGLRAKMAELSDQETFYQAIKDTIFTAQKCVDTATTYIDHIRDKKRESRDKALNSTPAELLNGNFYAMLTGAVVDMRNVSPEELAKMKSSPKKNSKTLVRMGQEALDQLHEYLNAIGVQDLEIPFLKQYSSFGKMMGDVVDNLSGGTHVDYDLEMRAREFAGNIRKSLEKMNYKLELQSSICENSLIESQKKFDAIIERLQKDCAERNADRIAELKLAEAKRLAEENVIVRLNVDKQADEMNSEMEFDPFADGMMPSTEE